MDNIEPAILFLSLHVQNNEFLIHRHHKHTPCATDLLFFSAITEVYRAASLELSLLSLQLFAIPWEHVLNPKWNHTHHTGSIAVAMKFYLSTSPSTISVLPTMATTSAIIAPRDISLRTLRLTKAGDRAFTRYGVVEPSLTI